MAFKPDTFADHVEKLLQYYLQQQTATQHMLPQLFFAGQTAAALPYAFAWERFSGHPDVELKPPTRADKHRLPRMAFPKTADAAIIRSPDGRLRIPAEWFRHVEHAFYTEIRGKLVASGLPRMALMDMVSAYEVFFARVLEAALTARPNALGDRKIAAKDLQQFATIEEATTSLIRHQVEEVLRSSHPDQLDWLKKTFGVPLPPDELVGRFVELTQRRHVLVHAGGLADRSYLNNCKKHKVDVEHVRESDDLTPSQDYTLGAANTLMEVGIWVAQAVTRTLCTRADHVITAANRALAELSNDALHQGQLLLAENLFSLARAFDATDPVQDEHLIDVRLYAATAMHLQGRVDECQTLVEHTLGPAPLPRHQLARHLLFAELDKAFPLACDLGENSTIDEEAFDFEFVYLALRAHPPFLAWYRDHYGHELRQLSAPPEDTRDRANQRVMRWLFQLRTLD